MEYQFLGHTNHQSIKTLDEKQCAVLCNEIRDEIINTVTKNGGHLSSNLGIVELTVALHRVFDSPKDRFIFDVSHQCYVHKLLTDRYDKFASLRQPGGLSGFQKRSESEHDCFGGGHASTSLSAALGFAEADRILGRDNYTIAIAGDGAFTGGMIHEAMNNCHEGLRLIFILNENEMSISPNIGGFARYIANVRNKEGYFGTKRFLRRTLRAIPGIGKSMVRFVSKQKSRIKNLLYATNYFEKLGFYYLGPVDGHDVTKLERLLREARETDRPVVLHVKTTKGHGFTPAEDDPGKFHGISAGYEINAVSEPSETFSTHFGNKLTALSVEDKTICAITAAMVDGTGLVPFSKKHPDRFFDVGIAEEHALTFAAGLSAAGMRPVFAVYSTFLQRCYDQLIHDVALQNLPLTIAVDRAGIAKNDGPTHHGIYDVSMALSVPNTQIWAPLNFKAMDAILPIALDSDQCDFIRYRSGGEFADADKRMPYAIPEDFVRSTVDENPSAVILTYGQIAEQALLARETARQKGVCLRVVALEKLYQSDEGLDRITKELIPAGSKVIFLEEGVENGGCAIHYALRLGKRGGVCKIMAMKEGVTAFKKDEPIYKTLGISYTDILSYLNI